ncbi:hypothetical protein C8R43DRAFT_948099 [Mycena crocata]|nr:hypothetical protein C8R43DRAFT_948099 [Mycena crocata]
MGRFGKPIPSCRPTKPVAQLQGLFFDGHLTREEHSWLGRSESYAHEAWQQAGTRQGRYNDCGGCATHLQDVYRRPRAQVLMSTRNSDSDREYMNSEIWSERTLYSGNSSTVGNYGGRKDDWDEGSNSDSDTESMRALAPGGGKDKSDTSSMIGSIRSSKSADKYKFDTDSMITLSQSNFSQETLHRHLRWPIGRGIHHAADATNISGCKEDISFTAEVPLEQIDYCSRLGNQCEALPILENFEEISHAMVRGSNTGVLN